MECYERSFTQSLNQITEKSLKVRLGSLSHHLECHQIVWSCAAKGVIRIKISVRFNNVDVLEGLVKIDD